MRGQNQHLIFSKLWNVATNSSFPSEYVTHYGESKASATKIFNYLNQARGLPACLAGGWCLDKQTWAKVGVVKECKGRRNGEFFIQEGGGVDNYWAGEAHS